jgi:hypothetical protein
MLLHDGGGGPYFRDASRTSCAARCSRLMGLFASETSSSTSGTSGTAYFLGWKEGDSRGRSCDVAVGLAACDTRSAGKELETWEDRL